MTTRLAVRPRHTVDLAWGVEIEQTKALGGMPSKFLAGRFYFGIHGVSHYRVPPPLSGYSTAVWETRAKAREAAKSVRGFGTRARAVRVIVRVEVC